MNPIANMNYSMSTGSNSNFGQIVFFSTDDPTNSDINYPIGKLWLNTTVSNLWILQEFSTASGVLQATWQQIGTLLENLTEFAIVVGAAASTVSTIAVLGNGELPIGSSGANPVPATLTEGTGINIVNAAGSITINSSGSGVDWNVVTGTTQAGAVNNGYIANNAGLVTVTLPSTSSVGDVVALTGINNATGWAIAQNAGNQIFMGNSSTTAGAGGSLASSLTRDTVFLMCVVADADWNVMSSVGNITIV